MSRLEYAVVLAREHLHWCYRAGGNCNVRDRHLEALGLAELANSPRFSHYPVRVAAVAAAWLALGLDVPAKFQRVEMRRAA